MQVKVEGSSDSLGNAGALEGPSTSKPSPKHPQASKLFSHAHPQKPQWSYQSAHPIASSTHGPASSSLPGKTPVQNQTLPSSGLVAKLDALWHDHAPAMGFGRHLSTPPGALPRYEVIFELLLENHIAHHCCLRLCQLKVDQQTLSQPAAGDKDPLQSILQRQFEPADWPSQEHEAQSSLKCSVPLEPPPATAEATSHKSASAQAALELFPPAASDLDLLWAGAPNLVSDSRICKIHWLVSIQEKQLHLGLMCDAQPQLFCCPELV